MTVEIEIVGGITVRLGAIVLDSDNIEELSDFYARMLGWVKSSQLQDGDNSITYETYQHHGEKMVSGLIHGLKDLFILVAEMQSWN